MQDETITAEHLSDDEPFDVQAARHQAYIHALAQVAATSATAALHALEKRGLLDAEDMAPVRETVALLKDALCPALLDADREMFCALVEGLPAGR